MGFDHTTHSSNLLAGRWRRYHYYGVHTWTTPPGLKRNVFYSTDHITMSSYRYVPMISTNRIKHSRTIHNCDVTDKSEAFATCKEMPVIPVNKVADKKNNNWKRGTEVTERHTGSMDHIGR
jgi:hypothetical protein